MTIEALPTLFGLLVGFLVGLTGVGGGSLMTPFLIAVMSVSAPTVVGLKVSRWELTSSDHLMKFYDDIEPVTSALDWATYAGYCLGRPYAMLKRAASRS